MDSSIISGLIGGAVAVALTTYLSSRIRNAPADGQLKYGWAVALLGWSCMAIVAFAGWAIFYDQSVWEDKGELVAVIGLFLGFGLGAIYSFGEYFKVRGTYDDEEIDFYTPWTGRKVEKWDDLKSAKFSSPMSWYVLTFQSGNKIRISSLLGGNGGVLSKLNELGYEF